MGKALKVKNVAKEFLKERTGYTAQDSLISTKKARKILQYTSEST